MRKLVSLLCAFTLIMTAFSVYPEKAEAAVTYLYVAPDGNDSNAGSISAPFKTLGKAKSAVQALISGGQLSNGITVYFRGGEYPMTSTVSFGSGDSGKAGAPVTYKAYNGEDVTFTGCQTISADKISPVTENDLDIYGNKILDRILDNHAKSKLMKIDLKSFSGTITAIADRGWGKGSGYQPTEIYVNNEILGESRWPNDEEFKGMIYTQNGTVSNKFVYSDPENHLALWNQNAVKKDLFVNGWFSQYWYSNVYKVGALDTTAKTCTTQNSVYSGFLPGFPVYFYNILEEIDMPGESYIDRDNKIAYFYPSSAITASSDVKISTLTSQMISMSGASYITLDGLNFKYTRATPINVSGSSNITINDCVIAHTSNQALSFNGTNLTLSNSHIYDTAYGCMGISGGNRSTLTPSGILITNNIFNDVDRLNHCYSPALNINGGCGFTVSHNLMYGSHHEMISIGYGTNDVVIEYNEIHHTVTESGDMGSIYWGRDPSVLGIEIKYNYFHNNGNPYNYGFNQSVFGDDGNTGAYIFGNVFYQGTLTTENGGTTSRSFPVKTNGGQYYNVQNNIFIDSPTAANFQEWVGTGFSSPKQGKYIMYNNDVDISGTSVVGTSGQWSKISPWLSNTAWKNKYTGTQWECFFKDFTVERYNAIQGYKTANDVNGLKNYINSYVPGPTNTFSNNVNIKITNGGLINGVPNTKVSNNYIDADQYLKNGNPIFRNFDKQDFVLTSEALTTIRQTAPAFQDVPFESMGIQGNVDGSAPTASAVSLTDNGGGVYKANYTFTDTDGSPEGHSKFIWYSSETQNGKYERMYGFGGKDGFIDDETYGGRFVKVEITPVDINGRYGDPVTTAPIKVTGSTVGVDRSSLKTAIDNARLVASEAVIGDAEGNYPQSALNTLNAAIAVAQSYYDMEVLYQYQVVSQTNILNNAIASFESKRIVPIEYKSINDMLADTSNWSKISGSAPTFSNGVMTIQPGSTVAYKGKQFQNTLFRFRIRFNNNAIDINQMFTLGSVYFRQSDPANLIWSGGNKGYLLWIKNTLLESQIWQPANIINSFENDGIFVLDKDYTVSVGVFDIGEEAVKWVLYVDGQLIHEQVYDKASYNNLYGTSGYFCIAAGLPTVTVSGINDCTLSYNANGGSGAPLPITVETGSSIKLSSTAPTRAGYDFLGWAETAGGTVKYHPGDQITLTSNKELFAVWDGAPVISVTRTGSSATINSSKAVSGVSVVFASYENGKLVDISVKNVNLTVGSNTVTATDFNLSANVKVMIWNNLQDSRPLCENEKD